MSDIDFDQIKAGDEVWVRATWLGVGTGDSYGRVVINGFGVAVPRSAIVKHIPQPWVPEVGDVVKDVAGEWEVVAIRGDMAVLWSERKKNGDATHITHLTLIRKGGGR